MINDAMNYRKLLIAHLEFRLFHRDHPCPLHPAVLASSAASLYRRTLHLCPANALNIRRCKSIRRKVHRSLGNKKPLRSQTESDRLLTLQTNDFFLLLVLFAKTQQSILTSTITINQIVNSNFLVCECFI